MIELDNVHKSFYFSSSLRIKFVKFINGCANILKFALTIKSSCFHIKFLALKTKYSDAHGAKNE